MSILEQLSSARGETAEAANKAVAREALARSEILGQVAAGLDSDNARLAGDCAEVFTEVAKEDPALAAPYADRLIPLTRHRDTRVRWEAHHALALVAALAPDQVAPLLPELAGRIEGDRSVIVRDGAIKALGEYGRSGPEAAREVFPTLQRALVAWQGKHAKLALEAMAKAATAEPALGPQVQAAARGCLAHPRANVRRLAQRLLKDQGATAGAPPEASP